MGDLHYCSSCGGLCEAKIPPGDDRPRQTCSSCGVVHYSNPRVVVGALVVHEGQLLICRRAIEPRRGHWTIPGGFLEVGETMSMGAVRETFEEAGARIRIDRPFASIDLPHIGQVHAFYLAHLDSMEQDFGSESLERAWLPLDQLAGRRWAFPVLHQALAWYRESPSAYHEAGMIWSGAGDRYDPREYSLVGLMEVGR